MSIVQTAMSTSLDGFIAGRGGADVGLHSWLMDGDTRSRMNPSFTLSAESAEFFDEGVGTIGAVVAGRRTYDLSNAWGGHGPIHGVPLFVVTHHTPEVVPAGNPPYTFVTDSVEAAVAQAQAAAGDKDVHVMGANVIQQVICAGLLDELIVSLLPVVLGEGVRLLDNVPAFKLEVTEVIDAPGVTHLTYRVVR